MSIDDVAAVLSGIPGRKGWSPVLGYEQDGDRHVARITDWVGGGGTKPVETGYIGAAGIVQDIADAVTLPSGPKGDKGDPGDLSPEAQQASQAVLDAAVEVDQRALAAENAAAASEGALATSEAARDDALIQRVAAQAAAEQAQTAAAAAPISLDKWAGGLDSVTPTYVGQQATVSTSDAGTHTGRTAASPGADVSGVANSGIYGGYALSAGAWRRDGDISPLGAASDEQAAAGVLTNRYVTPSGTKTAILTRTAGQRTITDALDEQRDQYWVYDGDGDVVPVVADDAGRVLLGVDSATGQIVGSLDVTDDVMEVVTPEVTDKLPMQWEYSGSGTAVPIIADQDGRAVIYLDTASGRVKIPLLDVPNTPPGSSVVAMERTPLAEAMRLPAPSSDIIYGHVSYGQSLSIGAQGTPVLSTSQPFQNLTFGDEGSNGGPKTTLTGNAFSGQNTTTMTTSKPLVEDTRSPDQNGTRGETICSGAVNGAVALAVIENGIAPANFRWFSSAAGLGGASITQVYKAAAWYQNLLDHVTQQKAVSVALGKSYVCAVVTWMQGEADASMGKNTYKGHLSTLLDNMRDDIRAITGQTAGPHFVTYQTPFGVTSGGGPALAVYELVNERADLHFGGPLYHLPYYTDSTHLTNVGYLRYGHHLSRVIKDLIVDQLEPVAIWPISATLVGTTVRVKFRVPFAPLVLDTTELAATTDYGFRVTSDSGTATISSVTVENGDTVVIATGGVGTNPVVRYAMNSLGTGLSITGGASGNLRDSSPLTFTKGTTYPLRNVAPHFSMSIIPVES